MDYFESLKTQSVLQPDGKRSLEIDGAGKIFWNSQLFFHNHRYGANIPNLRTRLRHAKDIDSYSRENYSVYMDLEIPFSAFLQQMLNCMTNGTSFLVKIGMARCHLADQFSRKIGREIAVKKAQVHQAVPVEFWQHEGSVSASFKIVSEESDEFRYMRIYVTRTKDGRIFVGAN